MRYQGRITSWKDDKGFGFITPNGGAERVFVHIKAFARTDRRPTGNELVTYELRFDDQKRGRAEDVAFVDDPRSAVTRTAAAAGAAAAGPAAGTATRRRWERQEHERERSSGWFRRAVAVALLVGICMTGYQQFTQYRLRNMPVVAPDAEAAPARLVPALPEPEPAPPGTVRVVPRSAPAAAPASPDPTLPRAAEEFSCDGRTHCSQMRSCEEATWFLNHCPGTRMDGDRDGVPCEDQHCR
jgi:cold shock CspA family protein